MIQAEGKGRDWDHVATSEGHQNHQKLEKARSGFPARAAGLGVHSPAHTVILAQ